MTPSEIQLQRFQTLKAVLHYFYRDNTRSGSHSRHNIKYHLVWIPKYRREVLVGRIPARLKEILEEVAKNYKLRIIAQEVMPDHVHVLVEAPPTYSPTTIARIFKSISSKKLREEFLPQLKQKIWKDGVLWATGYYAASVSDGATSEVVAEYIKTQWQRPYKKPEDFEKLQASKKRYPCRTIDFLSQFRTFFIRPTHSFDNRYSSF